MSQMIYNSVFFCVTVRLLGGLKMVDMIFLPNQGEAFFLWQMVYSDFFQEAVRHPFTRPKHVYLKANFDLFSESSLWENSLNLGNNGAVHNSTYEKYFKMFF